jgi:hypothetical protein
MNICAKKGLLILASHFVNPEHAYQVLLDLTSTDMCCIAGGSVLHMLNPSQFPLKDIDLFVCSRSKSQRSERFRQLLEHIQQLAPHCVMFGQSSDDQSFFPVINVYLHPADTVFIQVIGGWGFMYDIDLRKNVDDVIGEFPEDYVQCAVSEGRIIATRQCLEALKTKTVGFYAIDTVNENRPERALKKGMALPWLGLHSVGFRKPPGIFQTSSSFRSFHERVSTTKDKKSIMPVRFHPSRHLFYEDVGLDTDDDQIKNTNNTHRSLQTRQMFVESVDEYGHFVIHKKENKIAETQEENNMMRTFTCMWLTTSIIVNTLAHEPFVHEYTRKESDCFVLDESCPWSVWFARAHFAQKDIVLNHGIRLSFGRYLLPRVSVQIRFEGRDFVTNPFHVPVHTVVKRRYGRDGRRLTSETKQYHFSLQVFDIVTCPVYQKLIIPLYPKFSIFACEPVWVQNVCHALAKEEDESFLQNRRMVGDKDTPLPLMVLTCIVMKDTQFLFRDACFTGNEPMPVCSSTPENPQYLYNPFDSDDALERECEYFCDTHPNHNE